MSDVMEVEEILGLLPHRYPFMLVDRIIEIAEDREKIVGLKNLTFNELFFQGHFPGNPVMPGVLQLEAMAQVAGVMLNLREGRAYSYFMSINNAKFRHMVKPGDQLRIKLKRFGCTAIAVVQGKAYVGDELASGLS